MFRAIPNVGGCNEADGPVIRLQPIFVNSVPYVNWVFYLRRFVNFRDFLTEVAPWMHIHIYIHIYIYKHTCFYIYIHTYIYIYIERERERENLEISHGTSAVKVFVVLETPSACPELLAELHMTALHEEAEQA